MVEEQSDSCAAPEPDAAVLPVVGDQGAAGEQPGEQSPAGAPSHHQLSDAGAGEACPVSAVVEALAADPEAPPPRVEAEQPVAAGPGSLRSLFSSSFSASARHIGRQLVPISTRFGNRIVDSLPVRPENWPSSQSKR